MSKTALLIEMIDFLRTRPGMNIFELASNLGRSERTIYRWLSELSGDIGAPVLCIDGGYYLDEENRSNALCLTPEELLAIRSGLRSPIFGEGSPLKAQAESAWCKIRDASSAKNLQGAYDLSENYSVHLTVPKSLSQSDITQAIENAISRHHQLIINYRSQKSNQVKSYIIEPYAMVFRRHSWYLLAKSIEHSKVVQFKLLRLREATDTGVEFELPKDFSVDDYFHLSWEAWAGGKPVNVRVRFSPKVAAMVAEAKRHPTQQIHPQIDGGIIFEATVAGIEEIAIWVMGYGKDAEVLEPAEMRAYVREHVMGMAQIYSDADEEDTTYALTVDVPERDTVIIDDRALQRNQEPQAMKTDALVRSK